MAIRTVLICTAQVPFTSGGAETHVDNLAAALSQAGCDVAITALPFSWNPPTEIVRSALAWRMLNVAEANGRRIDLVIGMKFPAYLVEHPNKVLWILHQHRSAYNLRGTPYDDLSSHPDGPGVRAFIHNVDNQHIPRARRVFANSATVASRLKAHNAIDSEPLYHPPPRADRLRAGDYGDYILYPSRIESQKRQHLLIEAMRRVTTPVRLVLPGPEHDDGRVRALAQALGDRVLFPGRVSEDELIALYAGALGVAYVPFDEDLGYVPLEAMVAARPVIVTTDTGGGSEFVDDGATGRVVPPDADALADAFDRLFADRACARRFGAAGQEKYASLGLSWPRVVERLIAAGS
jgi:glycosyltransferase involved in cell wall biosynthesis